MRLSEPVQIRCKAEIKTRETSLPTDLPSCFSWPYWYLDNIMIGFMDGDAIFNPHQRCGYSDSPFVRIYFFYTAGSRNGFQGMDPVCTHTKKQKTISKRYVFLMEKCFEDLRQDEKHVQDLLESIMRPTDPVKEELRQKLFQMTQFRPEITKIRVCTFQMPGKIPNSTSVAFEAPSSPPFCNIWPR